MELDAAWASLQSSWGALSALAVAYSFSVIGAIVLIIGGYLAAGLVERGIRAGLGNIHGFDATLRNFFSQLARYVVLALVLVMVLGQFGVQTASIIAAIGAVGLAIGLALQGTLQNIAAGIMLLILRPFRIGESIEVGAIAGDVEEIGLFATRLRAADGSYILAPNSKLWNEPVRNASRNGTRRSDITFNLSYAADLDATMKLLVDLATTDPRVSRLPAPSAFISNLTDASMAISLRYWTSNKDFWGVKIDLMRRALTRLKQAGTPFSPAANVPARQDDAPEQPSPAQHRHRDAQEPVRQ